MGLIATTPYLVFIPLAYLLGSIPTGVIISRLFGGVDPRTTGSKNIGATNVSRSAGKAAGLFTLAGDFLKGALPVYAAFAMGLGDRLIMLTGLAAFIGHLFPVFLGFRGGKGVATAAGVMVVISPAATLISVVVFAATLIAKRFVSLGSMLAAASLPIALSFLTKGKPYLPLGTLIAVLVILKHKDNIKRLAEGTERRLF